MSHQLLLNKPDSAASARRHCRAALWSAVGFVVVALAVCELRAAQPAAPAAVELNASRITAKVLDHKVWPPGALSQLPPVVPAEATYYSLQLQVLTSRPVAENLSHLLEEDRTIEAFSPAPLPADLVDSVIEAVVTLVGDHRDVRWMIQTYKPVAES